MRPALVFFVVALAVWPQQLKDNRWAALSFLIGEWSGEGVGGPGQGSGGFSFLPDQDRKVLIRRNRADYPATKDKPAYSHTDLMIVYKEETSLRAIYFDNEDHVINYDVVASPSSVQFLNKTYRLTYSQTGPDLVSIRFEISPPDHPGDFKTYIDARAHRKSR